MPTILGIHNGHHASCAIVKDGVLVSAIEQERVTSIKGDGSNYLSEELPIKKCLQKIGISIKDVDLIVSSFQAIGPGGVGLIQPIVEEKFAHFDPFDKKHFVISHHYAHAFSAYGTSGFEDTSILISDLAGSTTIDGKDFQLPFAEFHSKWTNFKSEKQTKTECLSIYKAFKDDVKLMYREYCIPHCSPEIFICSPASLYDNISRFIFNKEDAHGELMALASIASRKKTSSVEVRPEEMFEINTEGRIIFKNDWQYKIKTQNKLLDYAPLALVAQKAFEKILLKYAQKTKEITNAERLVAAGGVFLNIKTNSIIESSKLFSHFHVPSSPHDAGIAIGCAYYGWKLIAKDKNVPFIVNRRKASDRIGSEYSPEIIEKTLHKYSHLCHYEKHTSPTDIANLIAEGAIIARFAGAAEFGPRALGGRSLLANPLLSRSKELLNTIKGRQEWRPVAPIVLKEKLSKFFVGPADSPYMNLLHFIKPKHRKHLKAILHPDYSARVQTLEKDDDNFLYEVLICLEKKIGYPIIVNTSLNGKGQPLIELPDSALDFFLWNSAIDYLLIEDFLVKRIDQNLEWNKTRLAPDCIVSIINFRINPRYILIRNGLTLEVSAKTIEIIKKLPSVVIASDDLEIETVRELQDAMLSKFLII